MIDLKHIKTQLLNLKCSSCQQTIEEGELVAIHNWGVSNEVINYGRFTWDEHERKFSFESDSFVNIIFDKDKSIDIDSYDLFRTTPRKLTEQELLLIKTT